ncbi:signal transduction histidine kinase [Prauserella rugosa]|uniref:histidine kinase n=1 Tax=Prauserella rugosa TaxID=43354 RepID=A0A660CKC3_9PSEU|nr:signal transduction histidine kinase [Prauserella rugosa]
MGDSLIAIVLFALDVALYSLFVAFPVPDVPPPPPWYVGIPLAVCLLAAVPVRRRHPQLMAYWVLVWTVPHVVFGIGKTTIGVAVVSCIALYTLVVYTGRRQAAVYTALTLVVSLAHQIIEFPGEWLVNTVTVVLSLALCWVLGEFVGARRAYQAEVEARLALLENERHQATRIAVAEERERIARELHDVVAHAVSVIVVHADGASYAVRTNPEVAERAIGTISETGRSALAELRRLLAILRDDQGENARTPQPTAADLGDLAERMRAAGLAVRLETEGPLDDLPAGVALGVYRIVQESLTNSLKHAGPGTRAHVRVRHVADGGGEDSGGVSGGDGGGDGAAGASVRIAVDDDGAGRAHPVLATTAHTSVPSTGETAQAAGNGLIGMRERANVHGGVLEAGPAPGGGWRVRAALPVNSGSLGLDA